MSPKALIIVGFVVLLTLPTLARPSDHRRPDSVRIAVIDNVPSTSAAIRILNEAYETLGIRMDAVTTPSRRALFMANKGQLDGDLFRIGSVAAQYPDLIRVEFPLLRGKLRAVARDHRLSILPANQDADHWTVAVRRGVLIAEQAAEALSLNVMLAETYDQLFHLLESGRVDLAFVADIEGITPLAERKWQKLNILPDAVAKFTLHHYLHKRHQGLAEELAQTLKELEHSGIRQNILASFRQPQSGPD
ncbi:substrate-binding periplasmic protein [Marinobacter sp.]|uniref:substrate-binding periplasmic protein n=1 Tax=Marinobacter sp. TaxID=50741 RepID=UPI0035C74B1F